MWGGGRIVVLGAGRVPPGDAIRLPLTYVTPQSPEAP